MNVESGRILDPKYVRPPCTISITANNDSDSQEAFDFYVAERNTIQFKIGLAASVLRKLKYTITDNYITAETEEDDMNHIKENWFFMVDIHPPRDMDEFHPHFYEPWKSTWKRLGFFLGLKLSSDPFKAIFIGVSFVMTKDINLVGGISLYDEVQPSSVEIK